MALLKRFLRRPAPTERRVALRPSGATQVLFVCMGNICRSPTAEGVFRNKVQARGMQRRISADSAGTGKYHLGSPPDRRAVALAEKRGYDLSGLCARQVEERDFARFDHVLAMDKINLAALHQISPHDYMSKIRLFTEFSAKYPYAEIPDPYFGGMEGFELVLDMVEDAAQGLLDYIVIGGRAVSKLR